MSNTPTTPRDFEAARETYRKISGNIAKIIRGQGSATRHLLAASIFHYGTFTVGDVKKYLAEKNISVRI